jgi:hypothetical protein
VKRLQNRIAESGTALPIAAVYAIGIWAIAMFGGSPTLFAWPQMACYAAASYMMVELNNSNALIRVRSRMVGATFIILSCLYVNGFQSLLGALGLVGIIATILQLFTTYQDKQAAGKTYYAFLALGCSSLLYAEYLYYVPILWILMISRLNSFSWRTMMASILGIITPYWFASLWLFYTWDFTAITEHLSDLNSFVFPANYLAVTLEQLLVYVFLAAVSITGIIHFWQYSYEDKIHVRQLFGFFIAINLLTLLFIALQPQQFDAFIRIVIICTSPILAHFLTLTHSRITNIAFFVILSTCIIITFMNLWMHF